jgi:hypothetical protein
MDVVMTAGLGEMEQPWSICTYELLGRHSAGRKRENQDSRPLMESEAVLLEF